jgi:hypothetical protein
LANRRLATELETLLTRFLAMVSAHFWTVAILLALTGNGAWAQGFRFGVFQYGGPHFAGPRFDGPRFDGPRHYDIEEASPPVGPMGPPPLGPPPLGLPPDGPPPDGPSPDGRPPRPRVCYSAAAARERVADMKLREPFDLMRKASAFAHAEALAGKLCRWNDLDVYEITLLRPDGRVIHVFMNAANGQLVGALNAR